MFLDQSYWRVELLQTEMRVLQGCALQREHRNRVFTVVFYVSYVSLRFGKEF